MTIAFFSGKKFSRKLAWCSLYLGLITGAPAEAATVLFQEDFNGITTGYSSVSCGMGCTRWIQNGVPTTGGGATINGGADRDWRGARFQTGDGGAIVSDIGVEKTGGGSPVNNTPVGYVEDDAGLMFRLDTTGYTGVTLDFDWLTYKTESTDKFVAGYFVGNLTGFAADRTVDLQTGVGSWGNWNELLRNNTAASQTTCMSGCGGGSNPWAHQTYTLNLAANQPEVWVAFWLDNGEGDVGRFDNVTVTATVVPIPPALWLLGSGLLGLSTLFRKTKIVSARPFVPRG